MTDIIERLREPLLPAAECRELRRIAADEIERLRAALAEPVLWYRNFGAGPVLCRADHPQAKPLYAHPPQQRHVDQRVRPNVRANRPSGAAQE